MNANAANGFIWTVQCRVAISRVIVRRRVILPLAGARWLVQRLLRTVDAAALESAWRLGGEKALDALIDRCFAQAPKRRRPKCRGAPLPPETPSLAFAVPVSPPEEVKAARTSSWDVRDRKG